MKICLLLRGLVDPWHVGTVRTRMRILGSVPLTNESGCGSGMPKKTYEFYGSKWRSGTHVKSYKIVTKQKKEIKFFLFFCLMMEGSGAGSQLYPEPDPYLWLMDPEADPGGPKPSWFFRIHIYWPLPISVADPGCLSRIWLFFIPLRGYELMDTNEIPGVVPPLHHVRCHQATDKFPAKLQLQIK